MARKKKYDEAEVLEKALTLFWDKGYDATSTRMLEKQMGINQFSIYASFGSKEGVFKECINLYKRKIKVITDPLKESKEPVEGIRHYFYDFLEFSRDKADAKAKGCFITNTINEFGIHEESLITKNALGFTEHMKRLFYDNLKLDPSKNSELLNKQADYLLVSIASLATSSKIFSKELLSTYIEHTFNNI